RSLFPNTTLLFLIRPRAPRSSLFPYTTLFRSQVRFQDRLSVVWNVDPDVEGALVPHMLLQPIIDNSLRHGIQAKAGRGTIEISRSEEHTSELQSREKLVCRLLLEKKKILRIRD